MNKLRELCEKWEAQAAELHVQIPLSVNDPDQPCCCVKCAAELRAILPDVERLIEALRRVIEVRDERDKVLIVAESALLAWGDQPVAPKETK